MNPVVLIQRTTPGDAYRYSRIEKRERTDVVETPPVPVGKPLYVLSPDEVEQLRTDPKKFMEAHA